MSEVDVDKSLSSPPESLYDPNTEAPAEQERPSSHYAKGLTFAGICVAFCTSVLIYNAVNSPDKPVEPTKYPGLSGNILKGLGTQAIKFSTEAGKPLIIDVECPGVCTVLFDIQGKRSFEFTDQYGIGKAPSVTIPQPLGDSLSAKVNSDINLYWELGVRNGTALIVKSS